MDPDPEHCFTYLEADLSVSSIAELVEDKRVDDAKVGGQVPRHLLLHPSDQHQP